MHWLPSAGWLWRRGKAAELLARLGVRVSLRVAAFLMRKAGRKGELYYCIADSVIQTVCMDETNS